jgi:hypothetical protein
MYGSLTSSAAAKFCNVHQRHSDFAASPSPETLLEKSQLEVPSRYRTAKSGSRDAPSGAELDLLAQIHVPL